MVSGDYDVDGFLDLFVTNGFNLRPLGSAARTSCSATHGNGNHWVEVDLVGTKSDRDATGARVYATANGVAMRVQNGGYHRWSQDCEAQAFRPRGAATVDLRVVWPSGNVQKVLHTPRTTVPHHRRHGIAAVTPGTAPAYPCGPPTTNGAVDAGALSLAGLPEPGNGD